MVDIKRNQRISIVVPLYGQFSLERAIVSVKSVLSQRVPDLEVVVSEQGERRRFPNIPGVNHIFVYHKPQSELSDFNPGDIRNIGITRSSGEFIYTNDADIVFLDPYFLAKSVEALKRKPNTVFQRPYQRRLPLDNFSQFEQRVAELGMEEAIRSLDLSQDFIATTDGRKRKIRVFEKDSVYRKTFTAFEEDFQEYVGNGANKGKEPMFWNENRHCGGNLFRRAHFFGVGGYCRDFINWGCEDSDLQWKFSEIYELKFFPDDLEVLHLDHPKGYFSPEMWARNEEIIARRKKLGVQKAISQDRRDML